MYPTRKDNKDAQINNVRVLFQNKKIIINPKCVNLIRQCESAMYTKSKKDYIRVEGEGHYDMIDSLIYFIRNINKLENPVPPVIHDRNDWFIDEKQQKIEQLKRLGKRQE